ncbi:DnaJ domain-containing protein [Artemisia annua]|uniref:DnaJ domain-containing protein n=1 Tax=Artemisia annua TaxID=35608 RepID=A0A2U1LTF2_ARTAN|nr:DnaJ domain-containing protein [Artemisia annua]
MDQFGVLVESIGFKAYGKSSAPLADLKNTQKPNTNNNHSTNNNSQNSINVDDLDGIFRSNNNQSQQFSGFDDVFGGGFGGNSVNVSKSYGFDGFDNDDDVFGLRKSSSSGGFFDVSGGSVKKANSVDDLVGGFGGMGVKSSSGSGGKGLNFDDLLGNFGGNGAKSNGVKRAEVGSGSDDLLSGFGGNGLKVNGLKRNEVKKVEVGSGSDDLLSGFGAKSSASNGRKADAIPPIPPFQSSGNSAKSFSPSAEDPFVMFENTQGTSKANYGASGVDDYLDSMFSTGTRSNTRPSQSSTSEDSVYDALFNNNVAPKVEKKVSFVSSHNSKKASFESPHNTKKASSKPKNTNDFDYLFGMGDATPSEEFQEIKGESAERRQARYNQHLATRERMIKALNEMNERDYQAQREQDEKHRVAATLEGDIKRWAVGKEGNLRALISSLQHVLWAGSGWQAISLTDLITSTAVKKAYFKATLFVHPDKVQQKGAEQKYIAEKVFELLKEAWNKFNAEEFKKQ